MTSTTARGTAATSEDALLSVIRRAFGDLVAEGAHALRDDGAALPAVPEGHTRVISTDVVVEGVDFDAALSPITTAGVRAIVQNASDLAAMGAAPVGFVWSLALPPAFVANDAALLERFANGAASAARAAGLKLYGGDLSSTTGPMVCSVTVFGDVTGAPLSRYGIRGSDVVCVSRALGASAAGLRRLRAGGWADKASDTAFWKWRDALPTDERACVIAHTAPQPELARGRALVGVASACMDVSDGLLHDAHRLARANACEITLAAVDVAIAAGASRDDALGGGEDYALLFTCARAAVPAGCLVIGHVSAMGVDGGRVLMDNVSMPPTGFDHFSSQTH